MPRTLARGRYTAAQVQAQVTAPDGVMTARFDLVDRAYRVHDRLDVTAATVDWSATRPIPRSLTLTMLPRYDLLDAPFRFLVKPWWLLKMDTVDGGWAEFPMGAYPFTMPSREVREPGAAGSGSSDDAGDGTANPEQWTLTLGDQMHYLDAGGVGPAGFTVPNGSLVTDSLLLMLRRLDFSDTTGVASSNATAVGDLVWSLRTGAERQRWEYALVPGTGANGASRTLSGGWYFNYQWQQTSTPLEESTTTWRAVAAQLHSQLGYSPPGFDLDNDRYVATPAPDYAKVAGAPVIRYEPGELSLLRPGTSVVPNMREIANRAIVTQRNSTGPQDVAIADLDELIPGHPLSRGATGFFIDVSASSPGGSSYPQLVAQAKDLLYKAIRSYESLAIVTLPNPEHDAHEVVSYRMPGDPIFDTPQLCAEQSWSFDLFSGDMNHDLRRLGIPGTSS